MFDLKIDISEKVLTYNLSQQDITTLSNYMLDRIVDDVMSKWNSIVGLNLHSTAGEYRKAMYSDRPDDFTAIIGLSKRESPLAMMLEEGCSSFDMKTGFMKHAKNHTNSKGGWYLTIPFRHATSEAITDSIVGIPLPQSVYDIAKQVEVVKKKDLPAPFNEANTHKITLNTGKLINYTHKSPIYEGLQREKISSTGNEDRGGYVTFRRVSDKSDEDAFMYPGMSPKLLMDKAYQEVETEISDLVGSIWSDYMDLAMNQ